MRFCGASRGEPGASGTREDQRPCLLADEPQSALLADRAAPDREGEGLRERVGKERRVSDDANLGEPEQLVRVKAPRGVRRSDPPVGDQLSDAAGRVVEVDRTRIPVLEVEDLLTGVLVREDGDAFGSPAVRRVEAVARNEECVVVERAAVTGPELERGVSHRDGDIALCRRHGPEPERARVERRELGHECRCCLEEHVAERDGHRTRFNQFGRRVQRALPARAGIVRRLARKQHCCETPYYPNRHGVGFHSTSVRRTAASCSSAPR